MNVTIVYASTYGNTRSIATTMAEALIADGHEVRMLPASSPVPPAAVRADLLLVGAPTHVHGWQLDVRGFLDELKGMGLGVPAAAFDTRLAGGTWKTGSAAQHIADGLAAARCTRVGDPASFIVEGKEGPLAPGEAQRAADWAMRLTAALAAPSTVA
jgi:flavodoxin